MANYSTTPGPLFAGSQLSRRRFLVGLSASVVAGVGLARCAVDGPTAAVAAAPASPPSEPVRRGMGLALPGGGELSSLPDVAGNRVAITLDDGVSSEVVRAYTKLARDTGMRLTYFVNGRYQSWTENRDLMLPLVESGQIQLGNHTWSHPDLAKLSKDEIVDQLERNHKFLQSTFGVDSRPYYRPPYGSHNAIVDRIAAELGYASASDAAEGLATADVRLVVPALEVSVTATFDGGTFPSPIAVAATIASGTGVLCGDGQAIDVGHGHSLAMC